MKATLKLATLATLLALGAAAPVAAADLGYGIKFGVGPTLNDPKEQVSRATLNLAFTGDWQITEKGALFAELNYRYFKADPRDVTPFTDAVDVVYNGRTYNIQYAQVVLPGIGTGYIYNADPRSAARGSADIRRDNIEGLGLSLGYRHQLGDSPVYVHGGVMLNALKYKQEVVGELRVYGEVPLNVGSTTLLYQEGLNYTPAKSNLRPGAFVGFQTRITKDFYVETNATWLSYKKLTYVPFVYSGQAPTTVSEAANKVTLDVNIGLRF